MNGKAEVVVQDAIAFQEMIDRLEHTESELQKLKLEILQRDIAIASEQLKNGEYTEYDDQSLASLLENIKAWGQRKLHQDS